MARKWDFRGGDGATKTGVAWSMRFATSCAAAGQVFVMNERDCDGALLKTGRDDDDGLIGVSGVTEPGFAAAPASRDLVGQLGQDAIGCATTVARAEPKITCCRIAQVPRQCAISAKAVR